MKRMALDLRELRELTRSFKVASVREEVDDNQVDQLADCLVEAVNSENEELLLESLRALRNLVAGVKQNQINVADKVLKREDFNFWDLCIQDKSKSSSDITARLRICVQFLGNLISNNLKIQQENFEPLLSSLHYLLAKVDQRVSLLACMPLLSLLQSASSLDPPRPAGLRCGCWRRRPLAPTCGSRMGTTTGTSAAATRTPPLPRRCGCAGTMSASPRC